MAADSTTDPPTSSSKSKKSKKKKSKPTTSKSNGETIKTNGAEHDVELDDDAADDTTATPRLAETSRRSSMAETPDAESSDTQPTNETTSHNETNGAAEAEEHYASHSDPNDTKERLEMAARQRDQLRAEVTETRQALESLQQKHEEELSNLNAQLEQSQSGKDHAETRYQKLLGQVNTIKTQLGERLKADAEDLAQARSQIEDLVEQNKTANQENESLQRQISDLHTNSEQHESEVQNLRSGTNVSQQNWAKERDDLVQREARVREEFENARQAMQDWEVLAMEERSIREGLNDRLAELEDQLSSQREAYDRAASERDTQSTTVDGLQRALQEIQDARKQELREVVEKSQTELEDLRKRLEIAEESATTSQTALQTSQQELEKLQPLEKEVRDKNLLIGKLRHHEVILNDHLTKALRFLKKGKPEDNVDRQLVTNYFLQFLALDRSDPKKFQILQLISAMLGWTEEQNESAGLVRPGASSQPINPAQHSSLRVPLSGFRRVSSSNSLTSPRSPSMNLNSIFTSPTGSASDIHTTDSPMSGHRSESLAELWSGFLEREAQEGGVESQGHGSQSRRTSVGSAASTPLRVDKRRETSIQEEGEG